ncbi:MAG: EVE domain-containing protein [Desulfobacteraceae bacterium]|jgi:predicted RNA-binding protein with PUA-like domain|nr:EVE domain-containing protein [Desulfobacteraceae bacterium]
MTQRHWLVKSEPTEYAIDDLARQPDQTDHWDGVRNFQARNFMRDQMQVGDGVLFYHSGSKPAVVGTAAVVRAGYPDHTAWDPRSKHFDVRSTPQNPVWFMVDIRLATRFKRPVPLAELRRIPELAQMTLLRRGNRLSVMPVSAEEYAIIVAAGAPG